MEKEFIASFTKEISQIPPIGAEQIPDIDLYMDQITTFAQEKLKGYKREEDEKLLTKTMINNYAKAKLIDAPVKKKYSKNSLIELIMIYHLKNILSIADIKKLLDCIEEEKIQEIYANFIKLQEYENKRLNQQILDDFDAVLKDVKDKEEIKLLTVLMLINQANVRRLLAEKLIDSLKAEENQNEK